MARVDGRGTPIEARDDDPYGLELPGRTVQASPPTKEGFTGHEKDGATGLVYAGARYYMPAVPRWTAVDPLADLYPGHSPYNYAMGDPISLVDPTGRCPEGVNHGDVFTDDSGTEVMCYNEGNPEGAVVEAERDPAQKSGYRPYQANAFTRFRINQLGHEPYQHPGHGGPAAILEQEPVTGEWWVFPSETEYLGPSVSETEVLLVPGVILSQNAIRQGVLYVMKNPNNVHHIFGRGGHQLGPIVSKLGGRDKVIETTLTTLNRSNLLPAAGQFEATITLAGYEVVVRGFVHNGIPKIGTMFVP